jgi:hypothetical protein
MILILLTLIHAVLAAITLCAGIAALLRIFAGRPFERWSAIFIKTALAASVTGLLFSASVFRVSYLTATVTVYVAGVAILAWKRFHLTRSWGLVFVLSLMGVLCLNVLVAVQHLFGWLAMLDVSASKTINLLSFITNSAVVLFFAVMGIFAVRRYQGKPRHGF